MRNEVDVAAVSDIETEKWDRFVAGGLLEASGKYSEYLNENDLVDRLLCIDGTTWFHYGGRFDLLWLADHIVRRDLPASMSLAGSRIIRLQVGKAVFRDSYALIPLALKDAAGIGGATKIETGLRCSCKEDCGGYCRIRRRGMSRKERRALSEYLRNDCDAIFATLRRLQWFAHDHDLDLCGTIGLSAWKTIQRWLGIPDADWPEESVYHRAREAYYGGRVQVFRPYAKRGWRYDINSAYPAALVETPIPYGPYQMESGHSARRSFASGREGIYFARVVVPEGTFVPSLPFRTKQRVAYPVGEFKGRWTGLELREAESLGCEVEVRDAITWKQSGRILADFCRRVWDLRASLGKDHPIGKWLKWFANSPTGKLAQKPEYERVKFVPDREPMPDVTQWSPMDRNLRIWRRIVHMIPTSGHVQWAAYLTSATRVKLGRQLRADDDGASVVYCDTDSCYATRERHENIGPELGQFALEGRLERFGALAPKVYRYWDPAKKEWHHRAKGIPEAEKQWRLIETGQTIRIMRGVDSFKTAVGGENLFKRRNFHRRIHADGVTFGDRMLRSDGRTYPMDAAHWREETDDVP